MPVSTGKVCACMNRKTRQDEHIQQSCHGSGDELLDKGLEEMVEKDLRNAWAVGPFTAEQVSTGFRLGDSVYGRVPNPRWTQHCLDELAQLAILMQRWARSDLVEAEVRNEICLKGCIAKDWCSDGLALRGTTIDLEAAFRQLPLSVDSAAASVLCYHWVSAGAPRFIRLTALPFGS
eukprot:3514408-Amphidinium_carterae.1